MKARQLGTVREGAATEFASHQMCEIVIYYGDDIAQYRGDDVEVYVETIKKWLPILTAIDAGLVIQSQDAVSFREPISQEEHDRGFY